MKRMKKEVFDYEDEWGDSDFFREKDRRLRNRRKKRREKQQQRDIVEE